MDKEQIVKDMIIAIGDNPNRIGLKDTPKRIVKMWNEIFKGYFLENIPKVTVFPNGEDGLIYDQMIIDSGKYYSHCEHHGVPFFGEYYFGYIPSIDGDILGLSKVARVVEFYSSKLQVQERLGQEIVSYLWECLEKNSGVSPKGMILVLKGKHLCKCMRGVKNEGAMVTSTIKGNFSNNTVKDEFLSLINLKGGNS
jgi:GTP cyclohydrolase I|tara:strand:- start:127 stop:714 length:588 start_codon:yes stop_codon:yes gene_type:complete